MQDRKAVLGLYNVAYTLENDQPDPAFPRLGQLIVDYEAPLRKLHEEFIPHSRVRPALLLPFSCPSPALFTP